jgi:DNA invertase Pin-like site-specific DNA recombinase
MIVIIGAIAELERNLIIERVRVGMRRAKLEGRQIGRAPLQVNRAALLIDRQRGMSLKNPAKVYGISKASVCRVIKDAQTPVSEGFVPTADAAVDSKRLRPPETAA